MDSADIRARIEKTEETIAKKNNLIEKRFKSIERHIEGMKKAIADLGGHIEFEFSKDVQSIETQNKVARSYIESNGIVGGNWRNDWYSILWNFLYKIDDCTESIKNAQEDIKEKEQTLSTYRERLANAVERENVYETMPDCMKQWMNGMIESWNLWDKMKRESVKQDKEYYWKLNDKKRDVAREHGKDSEEFKAIIREMNQIEREYTQFQWKELPYLNDDEIEELNVKASRALVIDLYDRVSSITGQFQTADNLKVTRDNKGFAVINGTVTGNGRTAKVQSVGAGGWNIQRFHIRTLVHEVH